VKHLDFSPVYPITDKALARRSTHHSILRDLMHGGARWVQIRDKSTPPRELLPDLMRCVEFAVAHGLCLIIDDRCDLVMCAAAAGVHLGQTDLPPREARRILGRDRLIGYSTHTLSQIRAAFREPVDYIGYGPVFATSTKPGADPVVGLDGLKRACKISAKPVVAIGGIGAGRIRPVLEAGAASAAVISDLMCASDISRQMELLLHEAMGKQ
jgi:thiamine-phosphate pyrophosphorylase